MSRGWTAVGAMGAAVVALYPALGWGSGVEVHGSSACLDPRAAEAAIAAVVDELRPNAEAKLSVRAAVSLTGNDVDASLKLTNEAGQVLLERRYALARGDCQELTDLYVLVVREFLRELPAEDWREVIAPKNVATSPHRLGLELALLTDPGEAASVGGGVWGELGAEEHRFMALLWAEATTWQALGPGEYRVATSLVGAGWRYARTSWSTELLLMGGLGRLVGRSYDDNFGVWVPWVELVCAGGVSVGAMRLGGRVALSPMSHTVVVDGQEAEAKTPVVELGLSIQVPL